MLRKRLEKDEEGFTLIELMVVVLIIAILIAIAIPTFLGAQSRAKTRQAQSNLRNAFTASKTVFSDTQVWANVTTAQIGTAEPNLVFTAGASTDPKTISVLQSPGGAGNADYIVLGAMDNNKNCWYITDIAVAGVGPTPPAGSPTTGTYYAQVGGAPGTCTSALAPAGGWQTKWS
jgi:type IV pilus assembly protein PilA